MSDTSMLAGRIFDLSGKTALVTGASSGLGSRFARVLAANGANVVAAARRIDRCEKLAAEIEATGGMATAVQLDVTEGSGINEAFNQAHATFGPVSIIVNNAGIVHGGPAFDVSDDQWRRILDVDLDGVFRVAREGGRRMVDTGTGGSIINIASVLGLVVAKGVAPYATAKAAVVHLTKALAIEWAKHDIRVNAIAPGWFVTDINRDYLASPAGEKIRQKTPLRRFGEDGDLDGTLLLLASDAGRFITGATMVVDGGETLAN